MSESSTHLDLVQRIVAYIGETFLRDKFVISTDLPGSVDKPPRIYGFVPDVFAQDAPRTTVIIGEAKTAEDLQTQHSRQQIGEFIRFVSAQSSGFFLLAVPWPAAITARRLLVDLVSNSESLHNPTIIILDGITHRAAATHQS